MQRIESTEAMRAQSRAWRREGLSVGFVPTMGYLHRGHASLMALARPRCDRLVVSVFVNPLQFGPNEDLARYPRDLEGDSRLCQAEGVDALFVPDRFYDPDHSTQVNVSGLSEGLCGSARPGHFEGVCTVVARLFGVVAPQVAVFGEKDYQQLAVIRRMTRDLALDVEVVGGPLIRDEDGLALSSRNVYLNAEQRQRGLSLHRALFAMAASEERDVARLLALGRDMLEVDRLDYLEVVDADSLRPLQRVEGRARALVAGFFGATRLIDNVALERRG